MRTKRHATTLLLTALAAAGCGLGEAETGGSGGSATTTSEVNTPIVDIAVDANRDGKVDPADKTEQENENEWTVEHGASFLANLDDDDDNNVRDADDEIVNGAEDEKDLARIVVAPWADAPDGVSGVFHLDPVSAANVRLYKRYTDTTWVLVGGSLGPCDTADAVCTQVPDVTFTVDEVRAGVTLGIEARTFRRSLAADAWTGVVQLGYQINDETGAALTSDELPNGLDEAKIRVAPWVLFGNLSPFERVWSHTYQSSFVSGVSKLATSAAVEYKKTTGIDDQWTQDFFQTAWTSIPAEGGEVQGMKVANARPWGQCGSLSCLPYKWLKNAYLGPDAGVLELYVKANSGSTYDSHGNHDLLPPYENGDAKFPLGRIIHGSGVLKETREFYAAQEVQGPPLLVKTTWLYVGHVDEVFSYVPAATARGWKLIVGSPALARKMLEDAQTAGFGAETMFKGKNWYPLSGGTKPAEISIDDVLADQDLMASSQDAQAEIDDMLATVKEEVGLADDEIVIVPYLMEDVAGQKLAYNPGTANILVIGDHVGVPKPFGPQIDGADIFEKDYSDRLGTALNELGSNGEGLDVYFIDDWSTYHALDGEVHCGTNVDAPPPADLQWWKVLK